MHHDIQIKKVHSSGLWTSRYFRYCQFAGSESVFVSKLIFFQKPGCHSHSTESQYGWRHYERAEGGYRCGAGTDGQKRGQTCRPRLREQFLSLFPLVLLFHEGGQLLQFVFAVTLRTYRPRLITGDGHLRHPQDLSQPLLRQPQFFPDLLYFFSFHSSS